MTTRCASHGRRGLRRRETWRSFVLAWHRHRGGAHKKAHSSVCWMYSELERQRTVRGSRGFLPVHVHRPRGGGGGCGGRECKQSRARYALQSASPRQRRFTNSMRGPTASWQIGPNRSPNQPVQPTRRPGHPAAFLAYFTNCGGAEDFRPVVRSVGVVLWRRNRLTIIKG